MTEKRRCLLRDHPGHPGQHAGGEDGQGPQRTLEAVDDVLAPPLEPPGFDIIFQSLHGDPPMGMGFWLLMIWPWSFSASQTLPFPFP